ncbi:signal peptidase II [Chelatococcus sp. SYSU_G07232]|uniref:Lipoprotein signal peptidase n=1 Tax=Chelatococcus albus TaxID=3047466 RepID=A0ABT7AFU8_9HYPH|nr:signal peptidase II [Chelatococcus sp. SYSU_G07232]MDJ1157882.1 signal peptidase II [Chelatococcus sp. SYSU_G07232]
MSPARLGTLVALVTLVLDQATKLWLYFIADVRAWTEPLVLAPFLEFTLVWNRGISYGLFQQSTDLGRWLLVVLSIVAAVGLSVWMSRTPARIIAVALGLLVGGAVGNAVDRVAYGAVLDFVHLHAGSFSWYVFNIADAAIVAGVGVLLYDSVFLERRRAATGVGGGGGA